MYALWTLLCVSSHEVEQIWEDSKKIAGPYIQYPVSDKSLVLEVFLHVCLMDFASAVLPSTGSSLQSVDLGLVSQGGMNTHDVHDKTISIHSRLGQASFSLFLSPLAAVTSSTTFAPHFSTPTFKLPDANEFCRDVSARTFKVYLQSYSVIVSSHSHIF